MMEINHIVRTAIRNIAGQRTLILYLYNRKRITEGHLEPEYTLFQVKDDYITLYKDSGGKKKWRKASLYNMQDRYTDFTKKCAFYRLNDELLVSRFCSISGKQGFKALDALQEGIMCVRRHQRITKRERKIVERMNMLPTLPRGLKNWVRISVFPHYIFYEYCRDKKPLQGYCTACRRDVLVTEAKHNTTGKCPNCRNQITFKASGKSKQVWDRATVQVLQRISDDELVLRIFKVTNGLRNWREPYFSMWESMRIFVREGEDKRIKTESYYNSYGGGLITDWKKGDRPRYSYYQYSFECDFNGHLYCKKLDDALKGTSWQYSQIGQCYDSSHKPIDVLQYFCAYNKYPAIEYLVKLRLTELARGVVYNEDEVIKVINENGKNLKETLGVEHFELSLLQKVNVDNRQLELFQRLKLQGKKADESLLLWFREHEIATVENVLIPLRYTTPKKLMRYIEKQYESIKNIKTQYGARRYVTIGNVLSDYKDYLNISGLLGYDFENSFVLFPKNLSEAHDQVSKLFRGNKSGLFQRAINAAYESLLEKYHFANNGLTLLPPQSDKEIIDEGHFLHHCVHSYVEKVAKGECLILFIRQTDKINEPFYTLEIQNNRVIQIYGKNHCSPTPEVKKFLSLWERKKLRSVG